MCLWQINNNMCELKKGILHVLIDHHAYTSHSTKSRRIPIRTYSSLYNFFNVFPHNPM